MYIIHIYNKYIYIYNINIYIYIYMYIIYLYIQLRIAKVIAQDLNIDERIEKYSQKLSFITLKDHKENFINNPKCRLINPAKSEIRIVSK